MAHPTVAPARSDRSLIAPHYGLLGVGGGGDNFGGLGPALTNLDGVPDGYRAMNERETIKVLIEFS
jgi:hypothetical protein